MTKTLFTVSFCLSALVASAQKVIMSPSTAHCTSKTISIEKIILSDTATQLFFKEYSAPARGFRISSDSYILAGSEKEDDEANYRELKARSVSGIAFNKKIYNENGPSNFVITFPPVKEGAKRLFFYEGHHANPIKMGDIYLIPPDQGTIPAALHGDWVGNKNHAIVITANRITYQGRVWHYNLISFKEPTYFLRLRKDKLVEPVGLELHKDELWLYPSIAKITIRLKRRSPK